MFKAGERYEINGLHGFDTPNHRDASKTWSKEPTVIHEPKNRSRWQELSVDAGGSPWSASNMSNNPVAANRKMQGGNRTASATLVGGGRPNKRQKVSYTNDGGGYVMGRGTPSNNSHHPDIITVVDSDNEDSGVISTPDHLNLLNPVSAKDISRRRSSPMPFRQSVDYGEDMEITYIDELTEPSNFHREGDGEATKALKKQLKNELGSDSISEFSASPTIASKNVASGSHVTGMVEQYERKHLEYHGRVDLRDKLLKSERGLKGKMKAKKSKLAPLHVQSSISSHFTRASNAQSQSNAKKQSRLQIKEWYYGTDRRKGGPGCFLDWTNDGKIGKLVISEMAQPLLKFPLMEIRKLMWEEGDFPMVMVDTVASSTKPEPRNNVRFKMGDRRCGQVVVRIDTEAKETKLNYSSLISWIKKQLPKKNEAVRGLSAAKALWDEAAKKAELGDLAANRQSGQTAPTVQHAPRSLKRSAPDGDELTPPPVGEMTRSISDRPSLSLSFSRIASRTVTDYNTQGPSAPPRRSVRGHASPSRQRSPTLDPDEVILCYPQGVTGAVNITNSDYKRLQPGEFLNDTLIEFGLKLWLKRLQESNPELASQIHVFSSFFYKKLNKKNIDEGYDSVRKWTAKLDLFSKKYIIVPINEHLHWYLVIIYQPEHVLMPPPLPMPSPATRGRKQIPTEPDTPAKPPPNGQAAGVSASKPKSSISQIPLTITEGSLSTKSHTAPSSEYFSISQNSIEADISSESKVKEVLKVGLDPSMASSCTITIEPLDSAESSRASSTVEEDPSIHLQDATMPSSPLTPLDEMARKISETKNLIRELSVSDYERNQSSPNDDGMLGICSASTSQDNVRILPNDTERASIFNPVAPVNFYGASKKAQGKQRAIPNQATIRRDDNPLFIPDNSTEDEAPSSTPNPEKTTYIFTLDSLGSKHPQAIKQLTKYLKKEAEDKLNKIDTSDAVGKQAHVPVQPNFCDCGLYLLHFAETFMSDPVKYCELIRARGKKTMNTTRQDDWRGEVTGDMRERLRADIDSLSAEWKKDRIAKEEAKRNETPDGVVPIIVDESSDDEVDIVETAPVLPPPAPAKRGGKGPMLPGGQGRGMRRRG